MLQPGDIQLLSNFTMLHTRTQYEDYPVRLLPYRISEQSNFTSKKVPSSLPAGSGA